MKDEGQVLFSTHFQNIYEHLGIFSYMYFTGDYRGIGCEDFIHAVASLEKDAIKSLSFLIEHGLIRERSGALHLNCPLFASMTMWDLLAIVEPWIEFQNMPPKVQEDMDRLRRFGMSQKLMFSYTMH